MKGFFTLLAAVVALSCVSCTNQLETMSKNKHTGQSNYVYYVGQLGGQVAAKSSMGTSLAADNQKSFADFMQTLGVAVAGWSQASIAKAKEVTSQFKAGQITKQQAQAQLAATQQAEIAAKGTATDSAIKAGAPINPLNINSP